METLSLGRATLIGYTLFRPIALAPLRNLTRGGDLRLIQFVNRGME